MTHTLLGVLATLGTIGGIALGWFIGYAITHWMPMPEPPKEDKT
ncbi:MAG: DUF551 domain-containing protein [Clostridia bacterium]|nr:DUF551 domain-containing protein [Clostridia bacterium]